jgi:hypothetical protein
MAVFMQQMQKAVEQREIGAGLDLQEQVRLLRGCVAARVDHDQFRAGLHAIHHAQKQNGVAVGHIRADHEEQIGVVDIVVRSRRPVRAERKLVAATRARHAQARIRFDVVGADEAFRELVDEVLRLDRHLAGHVKRQRIRPMLVEQPAQTRGRRADRLRHRQRRRVLAARVAHERAFEPPRLAQRDMGRLSFGAQPPKVRGMLLVAGNLDDLAVLDVQHHSAANAAVRAHGFYVSRRHGGQRSSEVRRKPADQTATHTWPFSTRAGNALTECAGVSMHSPVRRSKWCL